jgi:hypothetical protein
LFFAQPAASTAHWLHEVNLRGISIRLGFQRSFALAFLFFFVPSNNGVSREGDAVYQHSTRT